MQQELQTDWSKLMRGSMRDWALLWRAWRHRCPVTAALMLESAKLRRDWALESVTATPTP